MNLQALQRNAGLYEPGDTTVLLEQANGNGERIHLQWFSPKQKIQQAVEFLAPVKTPAMINEILRQFIFEEVAAHFSDSASLDEAVAGLEQQTSVIWMREFKLKPSFVFMLRAAGRGGVLFSHMPHLVVHVAAAQLAAFSA